MRLKLWLPCACVLLSLPLFLITSACRSSSQAKTSSSFQSAALIPQGAVPTNVLSTSAVAYIQKKAQDRSRLVELERNLERLYQKAVRLTAENEAFQRTNAVLQKQIVLYSSGTNSTPTTEPLADRLALADALDHWLTLSTVKRHNRSCQFFGRSTGRACDSNIGVPCKLCGG